jgi:hypothetical protein
VRIIFYLRFYIQCPSGEIKVIEVDFNVNVGGESWAKTVVRGHSLHDDGNGNGVKKGKVNPVLN